MKQLTASAATFAVLALVIIGIVVLVALGHPVPSILETVALVAVGGQAGAALPSGATATVTLPAAVLTTPTPVPTTVAPVTSAVSPATAAAPVVPDPSLIPTTVSSLGVTSTYPAASAQ